MKVALALLTLSLFSTAEAQDKYWVFFTDKPEANEYFRAPKLKGAESVLITSGVLSKRALSRRSKVLGVGSSISSSDFPVSEVYQDSLASLGFKVIGSSRWFNASVIETEASALYKLRQLSFVRAYKRIFEYDSPIKPLTPAPEFPSRVLVGSPAPAPQPADSSFYGPSLTQFELSGVPEVHALGINGEGVLIGMLDAGFRYEGHEALEHVHIIGEHDFIQNDSITANQNGDASDQDNHGTSTLSVIGGFSPGNLVGVAYGADFMLAKTEYVPVSDYKWEEDNWVEGIEWMEARGVDVVSSSVGYDTFVDSSGVIDSSQSYFWSRGDFDGRKSIASQAATRAAELGVVVVQAAGNEWNGNGITGTLLVPSDADSIITAGAVDFTGHLAGFSSTGPTSDGRIKPDLVADGSGDYVAVVPGPDTYAYESGTSFSTPLTAGIAALILSVRPDYTPMQVINLLKSSAVQDTSLAHMEFPNNFYGWGLVNAWNAVKAIGFVGSNRFTFWNSGDSVEIAVKSFASAGINLALSRGFYSWDGLHFSSVPVFRTDTANQYALEVQPSTSLTKQLYFYFDLVDSNGIHLNIPYDGASAPFNASGWELNPILPAENFRLFNNYPNPFSSFMHVSLTLAAASDVRIDVFDMLGRKIRTLSNGNFPSGFQDFVWNGLNDNGIRVASGAYLIRVDVSGSAKYLKAMFLK